ncbi:30S ribosomal protein S11 [Candidatus Azambacteria bacterium]|nr:30S ribosomal protein S11 [Candidatus Azambacteria bacterium]
MGKKRIIQKGVETLEEAGVVSRPKETAAPSRRMTKGNVYIQATYNNTIITITDPSGNVVSAASAGGLGFRGPKKATPFAAARVAETVVERAKKAGLEEVAVFVKGIGSGRESAIRSLATHGLNIIHIKDVTPVPHNGTRPPKVRRV